MRARSRLIAVVSVGAMALAGALSARPAGALQPNPLDIGLKPVLGWSSWSALRRTPTAALVEAEADAMVSSGLTTAGYTYVNLDDFYYQCPGSQGPNVDQWGRWVTDPTTFPPSNGMDGIQVLANYVHSLGLKFGIYLTPGISKQAVAQNTPVEASQGGVEAGTASPYTAAQIATTQTMENYNCRGMVGLDWVGHPDGAQLYYNSMADRFASWGVDYIKFDGIEDYSTPDLDGMAEAIAQSSNPRMLLDTTEGDYTIAVAPAIQRDATQFEYSPDIENSGGAAAYTLYPNVTIRFNSIPTWQQWVGPGNWQDLDSVEIGNGSSPGIGGRDGRTDRRRAQDDAEPVVARGLAADHRPGPDEPRPGRPGPADEPRHARGRPGRRLRHPHRRRPRTAPPAPPTRCSPSRSPAATGSSACSTRRPRSPSRCRRRRRRSGCPRAPAATC